MNPIGIGWAGPTILHAGTDAQRERYLSPIISGEEIWCQLFSEPNAGSDLAGIQIRAERDGDEWVVNGQKIWTSLAQFSSFGILIARTDPMATKRNGISYFVCPMLSPGIEVRPIIEMTGEHLFNEVFFTDVRIPMENLVGEVNHGWELAKVTLANERVSLSSGGVLWGAGPTAYDLIDEVRGRGGCADPLVRQKLARVFIEEKILDLLRMRSITSRIRGMQPGPETSIRKLLADEHGQSTMSVALDLDGTGAMIENPKNQWWRGYLFSPALTVGGGTSEIQRNILGERVLGLPGEPVSG
jgi:alkylation response protein AidB-like acyl-CoA dehydrogenase